MVLYTIHAVVIFLVCSQLMFDIYFHTLSVCLYNMTNDHWCTQSIVTLTHRSKTNDSLVSARNITKHLADDTSGTPSITWPNLVSIKPREFYSNTWFLWRSDLAHSSASFTENIFLSRQIQGEVFCKSCSVPWSWCCPFSLRIYFLD